jgi:hypothetical protein
MKTFSREFDSQDTTQLRVHHQITKHHNLIKRYYYEPSKLHKNKNQNTNQQHQVLNETNRKQNEIKKTNCKHNIKRIV